METLGETLGDTLGGIGAALAWFDAQRMFLLAVPITLVLYLCGRREELGRHAIQNTAATILVMALNIAALALFHEDINAGAQAVYNALGVPKLPAGTWDGTPLWLVTLIALVARDFCDYTIHRLMHRVSWLWPAHAAHHSDTHVNVFTTFRVHAAETVLMSLTYIVLLTWLQMPQALPFAFALAMLHNMYVHMNVGWDHGPLKYLIASPAFHRWHHADAAEVQGRNLANIMPVWDVIFGTYHMPGRCTLPMGGLSAGLDDKNPVAIWLYPFREWGRMAAAAVRRPARTRAERTAGETQSQTFPGQ